ncbi:hypothetical protein D9M68_816550 [compost metagenome]
MASNRVKLRCLVSVGKPVFVNSFKSSSEQREHRFIALTQAFPSFSDVTVTAWWLYDAVSVISRKGVAMSEDNEWVKACLLQQRTKQHGEIETGCQAVLSQVTWAPYLLPIPFETRWRQCIVEPHGNHGAPDRRENFPSMRGTAGVAIQSSALAMLAQQLGRFL